MLPFCPSDLAGLSGTYCGVGVLLVWIGSVIPPNKSLPLAQTQLSLGVAMMVSAEVARE